jgi:hypothetical protein
VRIEDLSFASDEDGVCFAISESTASLEGWTLVSKLDDDVRSAPFRQETVWSNDFGSNLVGRGEERQAWVAVCNHEWEAVELIPPESPGATEPSR